MGQGKPTLVDVAEQAGVSKMTASRALRGEKGVSKKSLEKVRNAAKELGYVGNPLAMSLSNQSSNLIGVIVPSMSNVVFPEVLSGIAQVIEGTGLQPVFGVTEYDPAREHETIRQMLSWRPAGLIVAGVDQPSETQALLRSGGVPVVQIMDTDGDPIDSCVGISNFEAGAAIARALLARGRKVFGYIGAVDERAAKRLAGFQQELEAQGIHFQQVLTSNSSSSMMLGKDLTQQILRDHPTLDCIYYSNDDMAAGGGFACIELGLEIPKELALVGFNGLGFIEALPCEIATSRSPRREIGQRAAEMILARLYSPEDQPSETVTFVPEIELGTL
ncbi:LacI family DNA-binding transcriptional regulator [Falsihalocynthiibacter sp. SS001]|uniref:LacI family DNA-binding transcriptional regulator n=1 Tax=Falsihalocynthiibacter sp. SS001 TaxID=3349698 RepID=UPI0036D3BE6A